MADVSTVINAPPEFIEAAAKPYITQLQQATGNLSQANLGNVYGSQFVAGLDPLQQQAQQLAQQGIGGYQPFLTSAGALQSQAQQAAGQAGTLAGQAGQFVGPQAYQQFMSPYQKDVIDASLQEFDKQAAKGLPTLAAQAVNAGAFGGGREGIQRAEYQQASDKNRAALQAQLLQQGFGQAQQAAGQAFNQQQALANQQLGLGQALSGLGQQQIGLGQAGQTFLGQDIGALSSLGAQNQGVTQAQLTADQQLAQQQLMQPLQATQALGSGITSLIAGYPGGTQTQMQPSPTALQTGIGLGSTLAGLYRAFPGT